MNDLKFIGIIPARYSSQRFPGKPLADICGMTMIERVWRQTRRALDDVYVATDDERIADAVNSFGGQVVMTRTDHRSGTDRCNEAYHKICKQADVVINIQGDEPFINPAQLEALKNCFSDPTVDIATLIKPFVPGTPYSVMADPNTPKAIVNFNGEAVYFSRSVIPFLRGVEKDLWSSKNTYYKHIGVYAFRAEVLKKVSQLKQTPLELAESLEQLRWLENGLKIKTAVTDIETIGIDTPDDLAAAEEYIKHLKI